MIWKFYFNTYLHHPETIVLNVTFIVLVFQRWYFLDYGEYPPNRTAACLIWTLEFMVGFSSEIWFLNLYW